MNRLITWFSALAAVILIPWSASAGVFELSASFSWNQSYYSAGNQDWSRRWAASVGYYFSELSEIELSFMDVTNRTIISGYQDTTFHDQIYSIEWVQNLTPKTFPIQPYLKAGVGQLNRDASGTYAFGASPPAIYDSITGVFAAGLRLYITKSFALRAEGTTYLVGGVLSTWQNNFTVQGGISLYL